VCSPRHHALPVFAILPDLSPAGCRPRFHPDPAGGDGCGDGRFLIAAVESYGCRALGIEINPATAALARRRVAASPAKERIRIVVGDARRYDLSQATIVTFYLDPELVAELTPKLTGARAIASYQHDMFDRTTIRVRHTDHPIYVWRR
jgi:hypothetical protein